MTCRSLRLLVGPQHKPQCDLMTFSLEQGVPHFACEAVPSILPQGPGRARSCPAEPAGTVLGSPG